MLVLKVLLGCSQAQKEAIELKSRTKAYETVVEQNKANKARLAIAKREFKDLEWTNEVSCRLPETA